VPSSIVVSGASTASGRSGTIAALSFTLRIEARLSSCLLPVLANRDGRATSMPIHVSDGTRDAGTLWRTYLDWLAEHVPQATALLNPPADEAAITEVEALVGQRLPESVKAGWRLHDGQVIDTELGVAFGFWWQPVAEVAREWTSWRRVREGQDDDFFEELNLSQRSYPEKAIKRQYTSPGWIPLLRWPFDGDYVGLDYDPGPLGRPGQVINFGRDQENKFVIADEFSTLLAWLVQEATAGHVDRDRSRLLHRDGILVNALAQASGARFD